MLTIRTSLSVEDLVDAIVNRCLEYGGPFRDAFWAGASCALEQFGFDLDECYKIANEIER